MKLAAMMLWLIGSWTLVTLLIGGMATQGSKPYVTTLLETAPFTGIAVGAVGLFLVAAWLEERASRRG